MPALAQLIQPVASPGAVVEESMQIASLLGLLFSSRNFVNRKSESFAPIVKAPINLTSLQL